MQYQQLVECRQVIMLTWMMEAFELHKCRVVGWQWTNHSLRCNCDLKDSHSVHSNAFLLPSLSSPVWHQILRSFGFLHPRDTIEAPLIKLWLCGGFVGEFSQFNCAYYAQGFQQRDSNSQRSALWLRHFPSLTVWWMHDDDRIPSTDMAGWRQVVTTSCYWDSGFGGRCLLSDGAL